MRRQYSERLARTPIDFQDHRIDDDFGFRLVQILNNLFCNCDPVGRVSNDDCVHRRALRQVAHIEQRSQGGDGLGNFRRGHAIAQIKRFQNQLFIVSPLGLVVGRNENSGFIDRFPKRPGLQCQNVQSFVNIHPIQFNWNPYSSKVRIKNHIEPGQLCKRFERHPAVLIHMNVDRACDPGLELRLDARICPRTLSQLLEQDLRRGLVLAAVRQNFIHFGQLLHGKRVRRIDRDSLFEFISSRLVILLVNSAASILEVLESSIEASLLVFEPVLDISGISIQRDLVFGHCRFEISREFGPVSTAICLACAAASAKADGHNNS